METPQARLRRSFSKTNLQLELQLRGTSGFLALDGDFAPQLQGHGAVQDSCSGAGETSQTDRTGPGSEPFRHSTFAVGVGHGDDVLLLPAQEQQPGSAVQNRRQRVTYARTEQ